MSAARAFVVVLSLVATPALADNARHRDDTSGGSGGSERSSPSRSDGSGHATARSSGHSDGGGRESSATPAFHSEARREGGREASRPLTDAQRRQPRAGTGAARYGGDGRSYGPRHRYYYGYYDYYSRYPYYYPYYGYYGSYDPYPWRYRRYSYNPTGSVRVLVEPSQTRVYVDGYYAGVADDFDGLFQRLHVSPGRHQISLKLEGHRTHSMKVYVPYDGTLKIHHHMARGEGEETVEDLVGPEDGRDERVARRDDEDDAEAGGYESAERDDPRGRSLVRLSVRPEDASVYVDGEFRGSGRDVQRLELSAGRHRVEVVRPGYRTYDREIEVRGEPVTVDVELERPL